VSYQIHPNVHLGDSATIGEFVIIGEPPRGKRDGELETRIGARAVIRSHSVIYAGVTIGDDFQTGHGALIREGNVIGNNVSVGTYCITQPEVTIGNNVRMHSHCVIGEFSVLEDDCWIGPNVVLTNARYPRSKNVRAQFQGPVIKRGAKISANATILPGVVVGENALVGAGAVVVADVPANMVVVGNPARVIGNVNEIDAYAKD
jgi:acetyltransferase-like isoleucine patch superfamily enzyme